MKPFRCTGRRPWLVAGLVALGLGTAGCAETQLVAHTAKRLATPAEGAAPYGGHYKVGNPYQIAGTWYYPKEEWDYTETGIASWYGPKFHGKATANGEVFDQNALTAAHRTLPMPSFVRVTNLENGRSLVLRVNDRGPFAKGRIIDVSRRGAQLLDFENQGTARVRVDIVPDKSRQLARAMGAPQLDPADSPIVVDKLPKDRVAAQTLAPPPGSSATPAPVQVAAVEAPAATGSPIGLAPPSEAAAVSAATTSEAVDVQPVAPTTLYVQAGAFSRYDNANRVRAVLSSIGEVKVTSVLRGETELFRVRVGPLASVEEADRVLQAAMGAGYPNSQIVVD